MTTSLLEILPLIAERVAAAGHVLLCLDYDGTLTSIVDEPSQACLHTDVRDVLRDLAERPATTVVVISGRSLEDIRNRVGLQDIIYGGNHGLEIHGPTLRFVEPDALSQKDGIQSIFRRLSEELSAIQGASVEDKGLTLSIHFRRVTPDRHDDVLRTIQAVKRDNEGRILVRKGKQVCEVLPNVEWNKGTAVCWIKDQLGSEGTRVFYFGDDTTDEDAFHALREHITVKVGAPCRTSANYRLEGPAEVKFFLQWFAEVHGKKRAVFDTRT